jgi:Mycothiol maleylpyruvate isomerase N-terminal domain
MTNDELIAAIESGWQPLRAAAEEIGLDTKTASGWTIAEMVTHVAFWEETCVPMVAHVRGHARPEIDAWYGGDALGVAPDDPWPPADVHNAREAGWARKHSAADVLVRCDAAHEALLALVRSLTAGELMDDRVAELIASESCGHYPEHQRELDSLRGGGASTSQGR